jgi:hypothetical protein
MQEHFGTLRGDEELDLPKVQSLVNKYQIPEDYVLRIVQYLRNDYSLADALISNCTGNTQVDIKVRHA